MGPSLGSFVIQELKPSTLYKVHIMASTAAGSTNGTSLTLVTMALGERVQGWEGTRQTLGPAPALQHTWPEVPHRGPPMTLSPTCFPDDVEIQFLFLTLGLVFVLLILLLICFQKNGR